MVDAINNGIVYLNGLIWSWPFLSFIFISACITTVSLGFIQFRLFFAAWRELLFGSKEKSTGDMTPFQAFINTLSTSSGNGSLAGVATAVAEGGPGAIFWIFVFGCLSMSLRFSEVFLATSSEPIKEGGVVVGGPMVYLQKLPGGRYLAYIFTFFMLYLSLASGTAMQANSIRLGIVTILTNWFSDGVVSEQMPSLLWSDVYTYGVALVLLVFVIYVVRGGAQRVVAISEKIVPFKVFFFFTATLVVLIYHYHAVAQAIQLVFASALRPQAIAGGAAGFAMQQAMRYGIVRSVNATEAGIGTAGVLFGGTATKEPFKSGIISMLSVFISANLVCVGIGLTIISSGVWNSGLTSLNLTIASYSTVFGSLGAWIVTLLSISFGVSVLVSYSYIARSCWLFLTGGRGAYIFDIIFCAVTAIGAIAQVKIVWNAIDLSNAGLLLFNIIGILYLLPYIRRNVYKAYAARA
ncbi:MAG: amino acid carrier protein [Candidatus Babeliales bacterium]